MSSNPSRVLERTATRLFDEGPRAPDTPVSPVLASAGDGSNGIGRLGPRPVPGDQPGRALRGGGVAGSRGWSGGSARSTRIAATPWSTGTRSTNDGGRVASSPDTAEATRRSPQGRPSTDGARECEGARSAWLHTGHDA